MIDTKRLKSILTDIKKTKMKNPKIVLCLKHKTTSNLYAIDNIKVSKLYGKEFILLEHELAKQNYRGDPDS